MTHETPTVQTPNAAPLPDIEVINLERHLQQLPLLAAAVAHPDHADHGHYLDARRQLAESQDHFIANRRPTLGDAEPEIMEDITFFEARQFSPLGWAALAEIEDPRDVIWPKMSATERRAGTQSLTKLLEVVDNFVGTEQQAVITSLPTLRRLWGEERLQAKLDELVGRDPVMVINYATRLQENVDAATFSRTVQRAADKVAATPDSRRHLDADILLDEAGRQALRPDQLPLIIEGSLQNQFTYRPRKWSSSVPDSAAEQLLAAGLIDQTELVAGLQTVIAEADYLDMDTVTSLGQFEAVLTATGQLDAVKQLVGQRIEAGAINLYAAAECSLLTAAEQKTAIVGFIKSHPQTSLEFNLEKSLEFTTIGEMRQLFDDNWQTFPPNVIISCLLDAPAEFMTIAEKQQHLRGAMAQWPETAFQHWNKLAGIFPAEEVSGLLERGVEASLTYVTSYDVMHADEWLPLISDDPAVQKTLLTTMLQSVEGLHVVADYQDSDELQALLPAAEFSALIRAKLLGDDASQLDSLLITEGREFDSLRRLFGSQPLAELALEACDQNPAVGISLLLRTKDYLEAGQYRQRLDRMMSDYPLLFLQEPTIIAGANLSPADVDRLVTTGLATDPAGTALRLRYLWTHSALTESQTETYYTQLQARNPALVYLYGPGLEAWSPTNTVMRMRETDELSAALPKWGAEFWQDFERSSATSRDILMKEAQVAYTNLATIRAHDPAGLEALTQLGGGAKAQFNNAAKLAFLLSRGDPATVAAFTEAPTGQQLTESAYQALAHHFGVEADGINRQQLEPALVPFVTYLSNFGDSPAHNQLLQGLVTSPDEMAYRDYRLVAADPASRRQAQEAGLLPRGLTAEQHAIWRQDEQLVSYQNLQASAEDVGQRIRSIVMMTAADFGIEPADLAADDLQTQALEQEIARLGSNVAELHKLPHDSEGLNPNRAVQTQQLLQETRQALAERQLLLAVQKITNLSPEEIVSGATKTETGKPGQPIGMVLKRMNKLVGQLGLMGDARLSIENIAGSLDDYRQQTAAISQLTAEDTIDLQTTLEIGAKPVGSCQHYATGEYRECLLGYTDPNTKVIAVRDGSTIVARSVLRLLETEQAQPALHVETIYTQSASPVIAQKVYELATKKAAAMQLPVYVSQLSQGADGGKEAMPLPPGFRTAAGHDQLRARAVRAPAVYVDSGGGSHSTSYQISGLLQLIADQT